MAFSKPKLDNIYNRTTGYCHICHQKLARNNYGQFCARGAWEVEHSIPQSKGGTNHLNNLYPACIECNRGKSNKTTKTARKWNNKTRAPFPPAKRKQAKYDNGVAGAVAGGLTGSYFGPVGVIIGAIVGAHISSSRNPDHYI